MASVSARSPNSETASARSRAGFGARSAIRGRCRGRRIDERATPFAGDLRKIPVRAHLAVGHVLHGVEIHTHFRDVDAAGFPAVTKITVARRVVHPQTVHVE